MSKRYHVEVQGIVQGVGYRPFVYGLAVELGLSGWVRNHAGGVAIEAEGEEEPCGIFLRRLAEEKPPLARVDSVECRPIAAEGSAGFHIRESRRGSRDTLISPDMGLCPDCLRDIRDPENRRYRYPFTNCTNCGPRFTIIRDLPYDRPATTMADFAMCPDCLREYSDPLDRRFHAQPNACPDCGPRLSFVRQGQVLCSGEAALTAAREHLRRGLIVAVKGIGGYHLVCDATQEQAVRELRRRKYRWDKPFALMCPDGDTAARFCHISKEELELLSSQRAPIVLLRKRGQALPIASQVAPGNGRIGVMLPYTPLHHLLCEGFMALVMTSGNISDEPIAYEDKEALSRLDTIADAFLLHDRAIFRRCDDSVAASAARGTRLLRRSRGWAPEPLALDVSRPLLACGGEQKNTFCLADKGQAFLSQHMGDMENAATLDYYLGEIAHFRRMFNIQPEIVAYDMHPEYLSGKYALSLTGVKLLPVQHHHAHLASVLAEHDHQGQAIGLIFDGAGYGPDGVLWGGEALIGDCCAYQRAGHLLELSLPGGTAAIRQPWRLAMSALHTAYGQQWREHTPPGLLPQGWETAAQAMDMGVNCPRSTGMGRLFDAVAALSGIGRQVNYEGQAAVELEQALDEGAEGAYSFDLLRAEDGTLTADWRPLIRAAAEDAAQGCGPGVISARFHRAVTRLCVELACRLRQDSGLAETALSGGCWQNIWLLEHSLRALEEAGFTVLLNEKTPCNDGGLSFGQAAIAAALARRGEI